ncbi:ABC transporter permease [Edaphobacter modestus]|uniref:Monosaccharide ABC transporter membrane protein (CUT2 family) n=1 Tax=Edaphobacter modestus TaxID=388466 RepID=A0A4V2G4J0_9BACT|nr:ABC transporter permease [Edaphobacter modestus]RZU41066.1 monosaccharide ABC transporter membrane protein (CUT2 family) [Edaphobacter modestus]
MNMRTREIGVFLTIVALMLVLAWRTTGYFNGANLIDLFLANMPVMMIAVGMTMVILTGQIDISVGSIFAICSVVMGLCANRGLPIPLCAFFACAVGAICGALNGALIAYLRIPSIVATLATMVALRDGLRWYTQGSWIQGLPRQFQWFGQSQRTYTVLCLLIVVFITVVTALGLHHLRIGRDVIATGSNKAAAHMAGIDTSRVVFSVFLLTGAFTGLAAVLNSVRFNQVPSNSGLGLELKVIAAVAVGGAAITGGSATITGTVLGVVLLGCIGSALTFLGINAYWEKAIQGGIILIAVAGDTLQLRSRDNEYTLPT